jgi:hypothetical protein
VLLLLHAGFLISLLLNPPEPCLLSAQAVVLLSLLLNPEDGVGMYLQTSVDFHRYIPEYRILQRLID